MDIKKLKEFVDLAKASGVGKLKYENKNEKYSVSFMGEGHSVITQVPMATHTEARPQNDVIPIAGDTNDNNYKEVTSPFVGTFYRTPSPGANSYVNVGDKVSPGQVLCIVEAMKIMNEIESEISGEIVEICVENETYVEYGQVLFKVR